MFVITVTPIKRGFGKENLSYFSAEPAEAGNVIEVPLRKGIAPALVLDCMEAQTKKAELRSSDFSLRKVGSLKSKQIFSTEWVSAVKKFSEYSALSLGEVMASLVPKVFLESMEIVFQNLKGKTLPLPPSPRIMRGGQGGEVFQGTDEERMAHYKKIIREEFARKKSVFLCLPTNEGLEEAGRIFEKGIEKYTYLFKAKMSDKEFKKSFEDMRASKHPVLIIASTQWLSLPRPDVGTIILENESNSAWRRQQRPFTDLRRFAQILAEEMQIKLILGDILVSVESIWRFKENNPSGFSSLNFRFSSSAEAQVVDMKKDARDEGRPFLVLSPELSNLVKETADTNGNMFIYATRKGLSPITVCRDCGEEVLCNNCGSPVVLYKTLAGNIFRCRQCGEARSAQEVCKNCGSWRLLPLGVGVERVVEEIKKILPGINIFELNKESVSTAAKARSITEKFYKTPGSVLVGTEMALNYLNEPINFSSIASIDSLFSIPDFRIREKIFHILLRAWGLAQEKFIIQYRNAELETIKMAFSGNMLDFYKREIKERQELQYPPFSVFIKITVRGSKNFVLREGEVLAKIFAEWNTSVFESSSEKRDQVAAVNCVIKIPAGKWPEPELKSRLLSLPPNFEIKIDPDNLL